MNNSKSYLYAMGIILSSATSYGDNTVVGILEPIKASQISNEVTALVESVKVNIGDVIKQGDVLANLDSESYQLQYKLAESEFILSQAEFKANERQLIRIKDLYDKGNASVSQLDESEKLFEVSQGQLAVAKAKLELSKNVLKKTNVIAPFDAWVGARHIEKGQLLSTSTMMFDLVDMSKLKVVFYLLENDLAQINVLDIVNVTIPAIDDVNFSARVAHIAPQPSTIKPGYRVEAILENSDFKLRPGFTARIRLSDAEQKLVGE